MNAIDIFNDKTLLITGGTGSFGNAILHRFLNTNIKEIRIFSRDEKKQDDLRRKYSNEKIKFFIGDVRDRSSVDRVVKGVDYIFHAAALKQVPSCEFFPMEAVKTNIIGTDNVVSSAIDHDVSRVICLSTDKAVYPINAMGTSKALMEKVMVAASRNSGSTVVCGTRYGNVMASRGSVIPLFASQIEQGKSLTITNPDMTRFMMTLNDAVNLVLYAFQYGKNGEIFVQKSPAATIDTLVKAICKYFGKLDHKVDVIGTRHGEKLFEVLISREEMGIADDLGDYFRIRPDDRDLNYEKYIDRGQVDTNNFANLEEYNSHNTSRLDVDGMHALLHKLGDLKEAV
jgi:UDP-N-acetylglucosamine 4,6-dehydratase/5-epimerase